MIKILSDGLKPIPIEKIILSNGLKPIPIENKTNINIIIIG